MKQDDIDIDQIFHSYSHVITDANDEKDPLTGELQENRDITLENAISAYEEVFRKWDQNFSDEELEIIKKEAPTIYHRYQDGEHKLLPY